MSALLELDGISKSFPGVKALDNITITLQSSEIHALLGENGAGKSTLMKVLCGIHNNDEGIIRIKGVAQEFDGYRDAIAAGVGIIFQEFSLIPYLNAVENIFLNREIKNKFGLLNKNLMRQEAATILERLNVDVDLTVPVEQLSIAQQQFVEIAKALSLNAKILVFDEPTATLTPREATHLFNLMRELKELGVGMFFISHHLEEINEICDTISVLRDGAYVGTRPVAGTTVDELVEMMVGRKVESIFPAKADYIERKQPILEIKSLQLKKNGPVNSFNLYKGEILGFAGLVGSGRTEVARAIIGADKAAQKEVTYMGDKHAFNCPAESLKKGIGLLPEDRKNEGLVLSFSVTDNITLNNHTDEIYMKTLISSRAENNKSERLIKKVGIKTPSGDTKVKNLSGGNQQKVVIARWLNNSCNILIFDEPTRGIDVGAKAEIYELMRSLTEQGISIIMISSELPEVIGVCDRVAVFREGEIVAQLTGDDIESNNIMLHATGNKQ
ncbi:sugar ABC transporter ATP-binding protein [Vibrio sp. dhg]|uniref:sugar ABC transporter ATP-binding protein n=1 Tax=Vibrio sp. dhg TaxID=2163016 RepID=UPI000E4DE828|nr:sugar ABC transporter ATP-binding protein [Vibrio sp. dhg]AXT73767.1 ribonucleotide-diphosphate reductase subunit alpha [Vibrio sp. dhg]